LVFGLGCIACQTSTSNTSRVVVVQVPPLPLGLRHTQENLTGADTHVPIDTARKEQEEGLPLIK
jgi:hypothetical protein